MEDLMPYLEKELQPCMKSKRADKRRVWFAVRLFPVLKIVQIVSPLWHWVSPEPVL